MSFRGLLQEAAGFSTPFLPLLQKIIFQGPLPSKVGVQLAIRLALGQELKEPVKGETR